MKMTRIALLGFALVCSTAYATGTYTPPPAPAPSTANSSSESSASAGAVGIGVGTGGNATAGGGNATGGSVGDTTATSQGGVGHGGTGIGGSAQGGDSYSANQAGDVTNQTRSTYVNFPQPVWTSVPTPYGCIVSESKAGSFGWNFISGSGSKQFSDVVCTTVQMASAATLHCNFAHAAMLNKAAFELMYPGQKGDFFLAGNPQNMDPVACEAMRRPVLRMAPVIHTPPAVASASPSISVMCSGPAPKPALRAPVKSRPACTNCCK